MFHDDPSPAIRERAACSLAQSGMFSAVQRRTAVPRLLDFADDSALDDQTRSWVFQALRDITGQIFAARRRTPGEVVQVVNEEIPDPVGATHASLYLA